MKYLIAALLTLLSPTGHAQKNTSTNGGRFQLIQLSDFRRDQFLVDTQTGKLWQRTCAKGTAEACEVLVWEQDLVENINI